MDGEQVRGKPPGLCLKTWGLTWHVYHAAVAVFHQVTCLTVNAAGGDAVGVEEIRVHGNSFAGAPGRGQVDELLGEPGCWGNVVTSP